MIFFKKKSKYIFIVEDNAIYANALMHYIKENSAVDTIVKWFKVGELALEEIALQPSCVIIDYKLNSHYFDAENGLDIALKMKKLSKKTNFIFLSSHHEIEMTIKLSAEKRFSYLKKDAVAFKELSRIISFKNN